MKGGENMSQEKTTPTLQEQLQGALQLFATRHTTAEVVTVAEFLVFIGLLPQDYEMKITFNRNTEQHTQHRK